MYYYTVLKETHILILTLVLLLLLSPTPFSGPLYYMYYHVCVECYSESFPLFSPFFLYTLQILIRWLNTYRFVCSKCVCVSLAAVEWSRKVCMQNCSPNCETHITLYGPGRQRHRGKYRYRHRTSHLLYSEYQLDREEKQNGGQKSFK